MIHDDDDDDDRWNHPRTVILIYSHNYHGPLGASHTPASRQRHRLAEPYSAHDMHPWPECYTHQTWSIWVCKHIPNCHILLRTFGGFLKWGYPQVMHFNGISPHKLSILGYPHSRVSNFHILHELSLAERTWPYLTCAWPVNWEASPVHVQAVKPEILIRNSQHAENLHWYAAVHNLVSSWWETLSEINDAGWYNY